MMEDTEKMRIDEIEVVLLWSVGEEGVIQ